MVTWHEIAPILTVFVNTTSIQEVGVIGSIARSDFAHSAQGNDLDVVLVVDWQTYAGYLALMWQSVRKYNDTSDCYCSSPEGNEFFENTFRDTDDYYSDFREHRLTAMLAMIPELKESDWFDLAIVRLGGLFKIDAHLMPPGWQENIDETQRHLPHDDPSFVRNITGDFRTVDTQKVEVNGRTYRKVMGW